MLGLKLNHVIKRGPWRRSNFLASVSIFVVCCNLRRNIRLYAWRESRLMDELQVAVATSSCAAAMRTSHVHPWWRHQMEIFSALLAICAGNSPVPCEFPAQRPVTRSFNVFFDLRLNKRLSKQSWGGWFETLSRPLWRHRNAMAAGLLIYNEIQWWAGTQIAFSIVCWKRFREIGEVIYVMSCFICWYIVQPYM